MIMPKMQRALFIRSVAVNHYVVAGLLLAASGGCVGRNDGRAATPATQPAPSVPAAAANPAPAETGEESVSSAAPQGADGALAAARAFAQAVAAGDEGAVRRMLHAPTPPHERLAGVLAKKYVLYAHIRTEAERAFGATEARRVRTIEAGPGRANRVSVEVDANAAVVGWGDDADPGEDNTVDLVHTPEGWKVSMMAFILADEPPPVAVVYEAIGTQNSVNRGLARALARIRAGELKTIKEFNDTIDEAFE